MARLPLIWHFWRFQLIVLVSMLRRSRRFPQLFLLQWLAIPVVFILDTIWVASVLGVPVSLVLAGDALVAPIVSFVVTGLWVAYVYKSVRVRNTFTRIGASAQVASAS
ncbi:DUF2569 family protein [Mesorhizobium sp.]|uniref:DUF2569 family protein n=1 Tax=Mesorhizobium sp. TaxID=1871066 RepID=UPI00343EC3A8